MSNSKQKIDEASARRVLIVTDSAKAAFQVQFASVGYETLATTTAMALPAVAKFSPEVVIVEVRGGDSVAEGERMALARQLRAKAATYALPIVFVFAEDGSPLRETSSSIGVDDYFALSTPFPEVLARLESLFWRVEAGRRAAAAMGDQRLEIDNFMLLLDAAREDIAAEREGSLAIIQTRDPVGRASSPGEFSRDKILREVFGFFKLQLRRLDAVAFYGPEALIAYLPGMDSGAAASELEKLRDQFARDHAQAELTIGLASFPLDGTNVEKLLEKCEVVASSARLGSRTELAADSAGSEHLELFVPEAEMVKASAAPLVGGQVTTAPLRGAIQPPAFAQPPVSQREVHASESSLAGRVFLAVSDAPRLTRMNSLMRSAGYEVRAAFDGQQALNLLRIEQPDLLVLDSDLDAVDGLEIMRRLWKQGGGKLALRVLFLDSSGDENARREALELGACLVLTSPYDPAALLAGLRQVVDTKRGES